jgi:hypothetical protein
LCRLRSHTLRIPESLYFIPGGGLHGSGCQQQGEQQ